MVDGGDAAPSGQFELHLECTEVPSPAPTAVPSPAPTVDACGTEPATCGTSVVYDNREFGNFLGKPGPERNFMINVTAEQVCVLGGRGGGLGKR